MNNDRTRRLGKFADTFTIGPGTGVEFNIPITGETSASGSKAGLVKLATPTTNPDADDVAATPRMVQELGAITGEVRTFAGPVDKIPSGWLLCDGSEVSRSNFSRLFNVIGTVYGGGNDVSTFNLPDLRGEFIRGLDNGRGVDEDRVLGSWQEDEFRSHNHSLPTRGNTDGGDNYVEDAGSSNPKTANTGMKGGSETRPRNVAMNFIIKT